MRVGVYFDVFSPQAGGGYTFEREILDALMKLAGESRHEFTLFFQKRSIPVSLPPGLTKNLRISFLEQQSRFGALIRKLARKIESRKPTQWTETPFQKAIRFNKIDIVWFTTPVYSPIDIPYVATVWDIQHRLQPWFPEVSRGGIWEWRESLYSRYLRRATIIIAGTETGKQEMSFFYQIPAARFHLLPHPTPHIEHFPSDQDVSVILQKYGLSPNYLFYPAQLWAHKNHANLLIALQILRDQYQMDMPLVLAGSNQGNLDYLSKLIDQLGLKDRVYYLGFVAREELIALYRAALALVYVTFFGPENLPPLEAFACGCPVIASNVAGAEEQLGDAALLVDAGKPEEIALAIRKLSNDQKLRESLINKGRVRAAAFTGFDFVRGVFELLDNFEPVRRSWGQ